MDSQKADIYMMNSGKHFPTMYAPRIREKVESTSQSEWNQLQMLETRDPIFILIISLIVGQLGIDRMLIGQVGLGLAKLLTCGGFGIWYIVDWFIIMDATKEQNYVKFEETLGQSNGGNPPPTGDDGGEQRKLEL